MSIQNRSAQAQFFGILKAQAQQQAPSRQALKVL
jgi:hypothetical protein